MPKSYRYFWIDPIIITYTGIMSCVSVLGSIFDGTGRWQHGCARHWARFILRISKAEVTVHGIENVPLDRPCLFASTHQSFFDIWVLLAHLPVGSLRRQGFALPRAVPGLAPAAQRISVHRGSRKRPCARSARPRAASPPASPCWSSPRATALDGTLQTAQERPVPATYAAAPSFPSCIQNSRFRLPGIPCASSRAPSPLTVLPPVEAAGFDARSVGELAAGSAPRCSRSTRIRPAGRHGPILPRQIVRKPLPARPAGGEETWSRGWRGPGHTAYFAGGCVRATAGCPVREIDIATSALPETQVQAIFPPRACGRPLQVVLVPGAFRSRWPRSQSFLPRRRHRRASVQHPEEDAQRRDFTINGMFYDPLRPTLHRLR
jgi:hypothetical protein